MDQIVDGTRTYEFRKYHIATSVRRVWFYRAAPHSRIEYFCEIAPAKTRGPGRPLLEGDGVGIKEFNECFNGEWKGFDYAQMQAAHRRYGRPLARGDRGWHGAGVVRNVVALVELDA